MCLDTRLLLRLSIFCLFITSGEACFGGAPLGFYPPQQYGPAYGAPYGPYSAASRTRMASPSHTLASSNSLDELQPVSDCTLKFGNQKLSCVQPFEKRMPSTEQECQQICEDYTSKCRGYQFDTLMSQCELFDVDQNGRPRSGQFAVADDAFSKDDILDGAYRHRRYASKNPFDEFLRDPLKMMSPDHQGVYCEPALVPAIGTNYVQSDYNCRMASIPTPPPAPTYQAKSTSSLAKATPGRSPQMSIPIVTPDCADGANARIQLIDGVELVQAKPVLTVQLDSPDACLHICRLNAHLDGTQFPRSCKSSSFDRSSGRCHIFDSAISPNGDLMYMPNSNSIYFEKFCIPVNELPAGCDDVIHRIPQHTLDKRATGTGAIITASTQIECIRQCISAIKQLGFECMSASYFFDWPSENCWLSRFTRISRPDIYVAERKQFVDYIEMSKCIHNWQHDPAPTSWTEWSKCDETMTRTRQRNCTGCKQHKERAPCHSDNAFQHEFQKSLIETEIESKKIASNFESARRYKEPSKFALDTDPSESSLFGEHDYENQHEISFFGPPQPATKSTDDDKRSDDQLDEGTSDLFKIRSSIRPIETLPAEQSNSKSEPNPNAPATPFDAPEPSDFASAEIFAKSQFSLANDLNNVDQEKRHKQTTAKRDEHSQNEDDENSLLKQALQEAEAHDDQVKKPTETTTSSIEVIGDCNPKLKCCPRLGTNEKSARLRGCVLGYRLQSDGKQIACTTNEYCAQVASTNLSRKHKLNYALFLWLFAFSAYNYH